MTDKETLWRNFTNHGFSTIEKWWKVNWWRASFQPQKTKSMFGYWLEMASHRRSFADHNGQHAEFEKMIAFCVKRTSSSHIYEALKLVAKNNDTHVVDYFVPHLQGVEMGNILNIAAERNHWSIVHALHQHDKPNNPINATLELAAKCGNLQVVKTLKSSASCAHIGAALVGAARHGHPEIVSLLLPLCDTRDHLPALVQALLRNQKEIAELLVTNLSIEELKVAKSEALKGCKSSISQEHNVPTHETMEIVERFILRETLSEHTRCAHMPSTRRKM